MSNKVIVTNNTLSSCSPANLRLTCGATGGALQYHVELSNDITVFKRNSVDQIDSVILQIDQPAYIGCARIDFGNTGYFKEDTLGNEQTLLFHDIGLDGKIKGDGVSGSATGTVKANPYSYSISWDLSSDPVNLDKFEGCNMTFKFYDLSDPDRLTNSNGFPLCDGLEEQCASLCGRLTMCGTRKSLEV